MGQADFIFIRLHYDIVYDHVEYFFFVQLILFN